MKTVGILISGRGSNMVSLLDAMDRGEVPAQCRLVISNKADAPGLQLAAARGVPTVVIDHRASASREEHDAKVVAALRGAGVEIVCLAGYMRLLSPVFVKAYKDCILNIHPALLPAFPGIHVQKKALDTGARFSGCTVHLVDEEVDHGPIILQAVVPTFPDDDEDSLSRRILGMEHYLYASALKLLCEDRVRVEGSRAILDVSRKDYEHILRPLIWSGDRE